MSGLGWARHGLATPNRFAPEICRVLSHSHCNKARGTISPRSHFAETGSDGHYDVLEVETRGFKGPRVFDSSGLPMHYDNQSIFKERIYLDKTDPNILHNEITVIDHALTRPWTVDKRYVRNADQLSEWLESVCAEYNAQVFVGKENYYLSADGFLMPTRRNQAPPDTRYFKQPTK